MRVKQNALPNERVKGEQGTRGKGEGGMGKGPEAFYRAPIGLPKPCPGH